MNQLPSTQACEHCVKNIPDDGDHPFPRSSSVRSMGRVEFPFAAVTFEVGLYVVVVVVVVVVVKTLFKSHTLTSSTISWFPRGACELHRKIQHTYIQDKLHIYGVPCYANKHMCR